MSPVSLEFSERDARLLAGDEGPARQFAMHLVVKAAEVLEAPRLIDVSRVHVAAVYFSGPASLDFAERLASLHATVAVPTTLTAGSVDLEQPTIGLCDPASSTAARRLVDLYRGMGCAATMTCAPDQVSRRPGFGEHIAWTESSAVVFANSVLGARTNRYMEFLDVAAAITGRVPEAGFHVSKNRRGQVLVRLHRVPERLLAEDVFYQVFGSWLGRQIGARVPVLEGLTGSATEDRLRALGAAAAATGSLSMFHAVGLTPEAATADEALQGELPEAVVDVTPGDLRATRNVLAAPIDRQLSAVCLGAPHFSLAQFEQLTPLLRETRVHPDVRFYVATSRHVLGQLRDRGWLPTFEDAGVHLVADRCTYYAPLIDGCDGGVMTDSAKWAYYAPGTLGSQVVLGSLLECVRSAQAGRVWQDVTLWSDDLWSDGA